MAKLVSLSLRQSAHTPLPRAQGDQFRDCDSPICNYGNYFQYFFNVILIQPENHLQNTFYTSAKFFSGQFLFLQGLF